MVNTMKKNEICELCGNGFTRTCDPESYIRDSCFDCSFWLKKINMSAADEARRVIVDGQHYRLGSSPSGPFRGFGGREFIIVFHDGRIVETSCLWHQDEIPERFRRWLPDNAIFVPAKAALPVSIDNSSIPF